MRVELRDIDGIKLAKYNPRKMSKDAHAALVASIKRFGFVDPVIVNDRTGILVGGHQRIKAAKDLGLSQVPVVAVDLDEADEKALNVALNKISGEWDMDTLKSVLGDVKSAGIDVSITGFSDDDIDKIIGSDETYTTKIETPVYQVTGAKPAISELYDDAKYKSLISEIEKSSIADDMKDFLRSAATRHIAFIYSEIAEFYAHADRETQRLMEKSALVIIDFDQAIENGFVRLTNAIADQFKKDYNDE